MQSLIHLIHTKNHNLDTIHHTQPHGEPPKPVPKHPCYPPKNRINPYTFHLKVVTILTISPETPMVNPTPFLYHKRNQTHPRITISSPTQT